MDKKALETQLRAETEGSANRDWDRMIRNKKITRQQRHWIPETEPKDYDIQALPLDEKNLHYSTYKRLGTSDNDWTTTTDQQLSQIFLKKDYEEREIHKSLVNLDNYETTVFERDTGRPERGFGAVLPRHPLDHLKMIFDTTYNSAFVAPFPYIPSCHYLAPQEYSTVHRKCHSQFTDTADYRRYGINTWQDESGVYANTELKRKFFKPTCPIIQPMHKV
uniref:Protein C9orf135 homolog isoform X2 n=1 Tax=Geotrypetes seraphini TaxID=260995 RepID=A0A6P8PH41_GEOSA|nr:protein C9orf135 homolog isoform X2 [Geotrypetes seraphini]